MDFEEDAQANAVSSDMLNLLAEKVFQARKLEIELTELDQALKAKKAEHQAMLENEIPDLMDQCHMLNLTTKDGFKVEIKPYYSASIKEEKKAAAFGWLREQGLDDIIKNEVALYFARGEDKKAQELAQELANKGLEVKHTQTIHPMTLKAFVKERIESGKPIPSEDFGIYVGRKAIIK